MIDFIRFESFWFDPTVHDISNNFYGFSKFSFFHFISCIEFRLQHWIRYNLKIHFENNSFLTEIEHFRGKPSCEILICQLVKSDVSALEILESSSSIFPAMTISIFAIRFPSFPTEHPAKKLPTEKIFWWSMMLGIGKTTLKSLQALHSALLHSISRFFLARRVILES